MFLHWVHTCHQNYVRRNEKSNFCSLVHWGKLNSWRLLDPVTLSRSKFFQTQETWLGHLANRNHKIINHSRKKIIVWQFSPPKFKFCDEGKLVYILYKTHTFWKHVMRYHSPFDISFICLKIIGFLSSCHKALLIKRLKRSNTQKNS